MHPPTDPTGPIARMGTRELRGQVAAAVRRAAAGERIVITIDGVATAQLGPLSAPGRPTLDDLIAAGLAHAPRQPTLPATPEPLQLPRETRPAAVLDAMRGS